MNTNHKLFKEIENELYEAIKDAICDDRKSACVDYYCKNEGNLIEIEVFSDGRITVDFYIGELGKNEKDYPNIREGIEIECPDWDDVEDDVRREYIEEDEWESHGFKDAADYYHWRYS